MIGSLLRRCLCGLVCAVAGILPATAAEPCPALLDHTLPALNDGQPSALCQYAGKVLLVVNTASYCGFTAQYDGLEKLHDRYKDQGLVVLGFPSDDFAQEPGSDKEIATFCRLTYGVRFPMFAKSAVRGPGANAFYRQLASASGSVPQWNFHKYLVSRDGREVIAFPSTTTPDDPALLRGIDRFLNDRSKPRG